jgi:uncharacterized radical SAM protein YgiQ
MEMERPITDWLPLTKKEIEKRGWDDLDIILVSGDAYVDHPAFGTAVIGRIMEDEGFRVGIIAQPNWKDDLRDFKKFGKPRYFFGVTHYDYWKDQLMPSILVDSKADLLVYGMGDQPLREMLQLLKKGVPFTNLHTIKQVAFLQDAALPLPKNKQWETIELASHEICLEDKIRYAANFKIVEVESNKWQADRIIQHVGDKTLVINPPYKTMNENEIDRSFDLPYTRLPHPKYKKRGAIPAYDMIKFSVNMHRGCFGGCSFCTISAHQGKFIASRSEKSILAEIEEVVQHPEFRGYISDLGGPSANMYKMKGKDEAICARCSSPSCIHPVICSNLDTSHKPMTELYRKVDAHPKVKKAFVGSGIRYDLLVDDFNKNNDDGNHDEYIEQVITRHISGRLKVAPEHTSDATLRVMRKPSFSYFHKFKEKYDRISDKHGLKQQLIPYFISSHPGCEEEDMANLAAETKDMGFQLEQVQDFTPTPMTVAEVIYYTGVHPYTLKPIKTVKTREEKLNQNRFFFWYKKENQDWIRKQLTKAKRPDLIDKLLGDQAQGRSKTPEGKKPGVPNWLEERRKKRG